MIETVCAEVDRDTLMRHMDAFARHTKVAGSPDELESLRYCERMMRGYGFETEIILHDAYISLPAPGARVVLGDVTLEAITHSFSRGAPEGGLRAQVVDVGRGGPDDYAGCDVRGTRPEDNAQASAPPLPEISSADAPPRGRSDRP